MSSRTPWVKKLSRRSSEWVIKIKRNLIAKVWQFSDTSIWKGTDVTNATTWRSPRRVPVVLLAIMSLLLLGACGGDGDGGGKNGTGTRNIVVSLEEISSMDPHADAKADVRFMLWDQVFEGLTHIDGEDSSITPVLATSWESVNPTTWRFHLREGVEFSNGEPFNAEAVKYNLERIFKIGLSAAGQVGTFKTAKVVDENTVDLISSATNANLPRTISYIMMVPPKQSATSDTAVADEPIGTGAYMVDSVQTEQVTLVKNPKWWGGENDGPDKATFNVIPEDSARAAAVQTGESDIAREVPSNLLDSIPAYTYYGAGDKSILQFNGKVGPLTNPQVREAAVLAVDTEGIRDSLFEDGQAVPGDCQFGMEGMEGYNPDVDAPAQDVERAKSLLEDADAVGTKIRLVTAAGTWPQSDETVTIAAQQLKDVGFDVDLKLLPFDQWLEMLNAPPEDRVEMLFSTATEEIGTISQPVTRFGMPGGDYDMLPTDQMPGYSELVQDAFSELDENARQTKMAEVSKQLCDSNSIIWFYGTNSIIGHQEDISIAPQRGDRLPLISVKFSD
jgi:peptide/nickel transport system substrate-binding protein